MVTPLHVPKTLLLVGSKPGTSTVGEILLQEMLSLVDSDQYVIAALLPKQHMESSPSVASRYTIRAFETPNGSGSRSHSKASRFKHSISRLTQYEPAIRRLSREVEAYAIEHHVERVWAILNEVSVIDVAHRLAPSLNLPLMAHVWDDVDHLTQLRFLDRLTRNRTRKRFSTLLQRAEKTAVICEAMQREYETKHNAKCCIVRHGISDHVIPKTEPTSDDEFRIGFSGGMYSESAWKTLLAALSILRWQVGQKKIKFVVMSDAIYLKSDTPAHIEYLGWRDTESVAKQLTNCDLLYLPQPFGAHQYHLSALSFPTKLSAYVNTGRPVLIHTPKHGSLSAFFEQHPIGGLCQELDPQQLANTIKTLAEDKAIYASSARCVSKVAETVLSRSNFEQQVRSFLGEPSVVTGLMESSDKESVVALDTQEQA